MTLNLGVKAGGKTSQPLALQRANQAELLVHVGNKGSMVRPVPARQPSIGCRRYWSLLAPGEAIGCHSSQLLVAFPLFANVKGHHPAV
jgi:hypothetical protein